jgi:K+ potassium transporter
VVLGYFPNVTVHQTSEQTEGQIYIPEVNALLATGCVLLVLTCSSSFVPNHHGEGAFSHYVRSCGPLAFASMRVVPVALLQVLDGPFWSLVGESAPHPNVKCPFETAHRIAKN